MVKALVLTLTVALLAGCVAVAEPFHSPLAATFASPLPQPLQRVYIPLAMKPVLPKKGVSLACGTEDLARSELEVGELGVSWVWNWSVNPPLFPGIESVPCIWDASYIGQPIGGNSEWLIGFNEPEQRDQANMTPEQAAVAWRLVEQTYPDRKLTSPQVVQLGARWLERWYAAYVALYDVPPRLDAIAIHTYWGNDVTAYQEHVRYYIALAERWGVKEVWVTEFAFAPTLDGTVRASAQELADFIAWLEEQPAVTRYAVWTNRVECMSNIVPDGIFDTPLYSASGLLTTAGRAYKQGGGPDADTTPR